MKHVQFLEEFGYTHVYKVYVQHFPYVTNHKSGAKSWVNVW